MIFVGSYATPTTTAAASGVTSVAPQPHAAARDAPVLLLAGGASRHVTVWEAEDTDTVFVVG